MRLGINVRFVDAPVTGVQRFAREVVPLLLESAECVLLAPNGAAVPEEWRAHAPVVSGSLRGHAWEQLELPRRARAASCDVVLHMSGTAPLHGGRDVMVVHDVLPLTHPHWFAPRFARWYRFVVPRAAARCACVITVSSASRDELLRTLAIDARKVVVVSQGVAPFAPASADAVRRARHIFDLPGSFVLTVGAGDARKNLAFLGGVAQRWRAEDGAAPPFVAVGDAAGHVVGRAGVPPELRALGRVSDAELAALYTAAAAFAYASTAEGFGRPPLEAMACGAPAVVADSPTAREVANGEARLLPLEERAWIDALRAAVAEPAEERATRARRIAARFTWSDAAAGVLAACRRAFDNAERFAA